MKSLVVLFRFRPTNPEEDERYVANVLCSACGHIYRVSGKTQKIMMALLTEEMEHHACPKGPKEDR